MPFYVYILYSKSLDQYYTGHTADLKDRIYRHNNSGSKATKKAKDWVLVHTEQFKSRAEASVREQEIKKKKNRTYIEMLVNG